MRSLSLEFRYNDSDLAHGDSVSTGAALQSYIIAKLIASVKDGRVRPIMVVTTSLQIVAATLIN